MSNRADAHEMWDELAAGYALHALEPDEEQLFTDHLASCTECERLLRDHELVAAQLGTLADDDATAPPAWDAMRSAVVGEPTPAPSPAPAPVTSLAERRRRRQPRLLGAAAGIVVLAAAGVIAWQATSTSTSSADRAISACQHRAGCNVIRLRASDGSDPAAVLVSANRVTMLPIAMGAPPSGKTYVLWQLLRNGSPTPVESFGTGNPPTTGLVMPYDDTAAFAVSLEPANVPPAQPTHVLAVGNTNA